MRSSSLLLIALVVPCACGGVTTIVSDAGTDGAGSGSGGGSGSGSGGSSGSSSGGSSGGSSGSSSGSSSGTSSGGRVPTNHRPSDAQCTTTAAPGDCMFQGGSSGSATCIMDSQCTSGADGRCVMAGGPIEDCQCTYDTCMHDTDCPTGELCACHGSPYVGGDGNTCVQGNCRVDSDCGSGGYCSPSYNTMSCGGLAGYYCHTPNDTCLDDTDCGAGDEVCTYLSGKWQCAMEELCP